MFAIYLEWQISIPLFYGFVRRFKRILPLDYLENVRMKFLEAILGSIR